MKTYELATVIFVALAALQLVDLLGSKAKPVPPQCLVEAKLPDGSPVQRWRSCTPAELDATT